MAGAGSIHRDGDLADRLRSQVRAWCQRVQGLLICTDGWNVYPKSLLRVFRDKVKKKAGPGRACLEVWPQLCLATVIKHTKKKRVVEVTRKITWGTLEKAHHLLTLTRGCKQFNTSLIERFHATMRERLASLTRTCRHAAQRLETLETGMYVIGTTYNFCWAHHEVSTRKHFGYPCTPAMAAGLTDHIWSVSDVLRFKVAPAPWVEPKRRGRPHKATGSDPTVPKRPPGRPPKVA
jgi:IS1 family transposase